MSNSTLALIHTLHRHAPTSRASTIPGGLLPSQLPHAKTGTQHTQPMTSQPVLDSPARVLSAHACQYCVCLLNLCLYALIVFDSFALHVELNALRFMISRPLHFPEPSRQARMPAAPTRATLMRFGKLR